MIIDYFKYDLYRKYQTSDGVTYTPLDEYQAVMTDYQINDDCGLVPYANLYYSNITGTPRPVSFKLINKQECLSAIVKDAAITPINGTGFYVWSSYEGSYDCVGLQNKNITDYSNAFNTCPKLYRIEANNWDTSNVTDMSYMFRGCSLYDGVDINEWNTSNVTNMSNMFYGTSLRDIDISNWDTSNVTDMSNMFYGCGNLTNLNISNWDVSKLTSVNSMFRDCTKLSTIQNIDNWETSSLNDMSNMFYGCTALSTVPFTYLNTSNVTDISGMFFGCSSLTDITLHNFDFSNVTETMSMFGNCVNLKSLDLSGCDFGNAPLSDIFYYASSSFYSNLETFNISNIKVNGSLPKPPANKLKKANLSNINAVGVKSFSNYFNNTYTLTEINFENFISTDATSMYYMFFYCGVSELDLSGFDTRNVTTMSYMFYNCSNLTKLNLSNFDTSSIGFDYLGTINAKNMFSYCGNLKKIICKKAFYDWCIQYKATIGLPTTMINGTVGAVGSDTNWEIID